MNPYFPKFTDTGTGTNSTSFFAKSKQNRSICSLKSFIIIQKSKSPFCKVQCLELVREGALSSFGAHSHCLEAFQGLGVLFCQLLGNTYLIESNEPGFWFSPAITILVTGGHLTTLGLSFLIQKEKRLTRCITDSHEARLQNHGGLLESSPGQEVGRFQTGP